MQHHLVGYLERGGRGGGEGEIRVKWEREGEGGDKVGGRGVVMEAFRVSEQRRE